MKIITMQSFDDNLMQMSEKEQLELNSVRMKEWYNREQTTALKKHLEWFTEYGKDCYSQSTVTSLLEALKLAEQDLREAKDKFLVSYYNYPSCVKFDYSGTIRNNIEWENHEMLKACSNRAGNAASAIRKLINSIEHSLIENEHPVIEKG